MAHGGSLHDTRVILQFKSDCERLTTKESMKGAGDTNIPDTLLSSICAPIWILSFWWVSLQVTWKGIRRNHESRQKESWSKKPLATAGGANVGFRPHGGRCAGAQEGTIYKDERSQPLGVSSGQPDGEPPGSAKKCPKYQNSWERKKFKKLSKRAL